MQNKHFLRWHVTSVWETNAPLRRYVLLWRYPFVQVFPLFLFTHIALTIISLYAPELMIIAHQSPTDLFNSASFNVIWDTWDRFDGQYYIWIAAQGYKTPELAAFFPLFPELIRFVTIATHNTIVSGLLISSTAGLVLMVVLYQLALEEFGERMAQRTILYLLVFPTAFFLWAIYPETLFLCLSVLCFYAMKHQRWWLTGIFGLLAVLDRPNGILLFLPCCIEYLRVRRAIRLDILGIMLILTGLGLYALYCLHHFGDLLAFVHAQAGWRRYLAVPGYSLFRALQIVFDQGYNIRLRVFLSYSLDLFPDVLVLVLLVLGTILRRFRLGERHWTYMCFAWLLWLFANMEPSYQPLMGVGRNILVIFPAFFILARLGEKRWIHLTYLTVSGTLCLLWCIQFLTGYRII